MERTSFADMTCSVAQCLEVVGDSWTMLIVRDAFAGSTRFDEFQQWLGIPRNTLKDRLTKLVSCGAMVKVPYSDHPPRYEYRLTDSGQDLWPVLSAMRDWGDSHGSATRPRIRMVHAACGAAAIKTVTVCTSCGEPVGPGDAALQHLPSTVDKSGRP